jgi:hypothetical protein
LFSPGVGCEHMLQAASDVAGSETECDLRHILHALAVTSGQPRTLTDNHGQSAAARRAQYQVCARSRVATP